MSPKRGLFQSLSQRVSGYRSKKKSGQHPVSPGSQVSETASEGQGSYIVVVSSLICSEKFSRLQPSCMFSVLCH